MNRNRKWSWIYIVPLAIVGLAVFVFVGGTIVQLLWNWLLPSLFGFPEVTFWQALGILALSRILFGGFGGHRGYHRPRGRKRWGNMTPEERERFRQRARDRFGSGPWGPPPPEQEPTIRE